MAIQADRILGFAGCILTGHQRTFGSNQNKDDNGSNTQTFPTFFAHQIYVSSPHNKASSVFFILNPYDTRTDMLAACSPDEPSDSLMADHSPGCSAIIFSCDVLPVKMLVSPG